MGHDATESSMDVPQWMLTHAEARQVSAALNRAPRVIPELGAVIDGRQSLNLNPDMADLWAHIWTHTPEKED